MMKMASGDGFPLRQGAGTGSRLVFRGYRSLRRRNSRSRFLSGGFLIYWSTWRWNHVRGCSRDPQARGARPTGGAPPRLVAASGLLSGIFLVQYFLYFPKIFSVNFQPIPRTFISAQKNDTMVVLLKTASVRVSSNKIIPKSYKIIVNMA